MRFLSLLQTIRCHVLIARRLCANLWRFDMQKHVTKNHPDKECPSEGIISEAEKGILEKKKQRTANALSVKDLEKLNEEELKLLPLKDFWDATKKVWKKNGY